MTLKWESNSRVKNLVGRGINQQDIIARTSTAKFPTETATVRLHKVRDKHPLVTIHFRGKSVPRSYNYWDYQAKVQKTETFNQAETMRLNFKLGDDSFNMNGEMDFTDLNEIMSTVKEVKEVLNV